MNALIHIFIIFVIFSEVDFNKFVFAEKASTNDSVYYQLHRYLFEKSGYRKDLLPMERGKGPVIVHTCFALDRIKALKDKAGAVELNGYFIWSWDDPFLWWDIHRFPIDEMYIPLQDIWRPDLSLLNSVDERRSPLEAFLDTNVIATLTVPRLKPRKFRLGNITILFNNTDDNEANQDSQPKRRAATIYATLPVAVSAACSVNMKFYPFDKQKCQVIFGSWAYPSQLLDFRLCGGRGVVKQLYEENAEFALDENIHIDMNYKQFYSDEIYSVLRMTVNLRRRGIMVTYSSLLPPFMLILIGLSVFYLPPESGERISLCITLVLTMVVFLQLFGDSMPNSSPLPIMAQFFGAAICLLTVETIMSILVVNVYYNGEHGSRVPRWLKLFVLTWLATLCCIRGMVRDKLRSMKQSDKQRVASKNRVDRAKSLRDKQRQEAIDSEAMLEGLDSNSGVVLSISPLNTADDFTSTDNLIGHRTRDSTTRHRKGSHDREETENLENEKSEQPHNPHKKLSIVSAAPQRSLFSMPLPVSLERIEAQVAELYELISAQISKEEGSSEVTEEWRLVAYVVDRVCFCIYIVVAVGFIAFWGSAEKLGV